MTGRARLVHIVLQTGQPAAMRDRYCTVLDAHLVHAGHGLTFLTFDDEHHRIALLELPVDNFATADEATAYMRGPEHDGDSVGPAFDVERVIEARQAGVTVAELTTRAWAVAGPALPDPMHAATGG